MYVPTSIIPEDYEDQERWREQAQRRRLLEGKHKVDVQTAIENQFAQEIAAGLEIDPDLSRNPYRLIFQQLNVAYLEPPDVSVTGQDDADLSPIITPKLWAQQQKTSLFALAMGESLVRVDWKHWAGATEASYRIVAPDTVVIEAMPDEPDQPGKVEELRWRGEAWTWEVWDVRDPSKPVFRIDEVDDNNERTEATAKYAPDLAAENAYPYRATDGTPILPYVLYHKSVGSRLWNWTEGTELTNGSLRLGALWTHWNDGFLNAAHPQRWALDVDTQAGVTRTIAGTAVDVVPVDRKSVLKFASKGPAGGSLGQFSAAMDVLSSAEALKLYEQGLAVYAGLNPADLQVTQGQSGYAIVVSRAGQRRQQKLVEVSYRMADQMLLAKAAQLANVYANAGLSENPRDYQIHYRALQPSTAELKEQAEIIEKELAMGMISQIDALRQMHPEIESDEDALERLLKVRETEAILSGQAMPEAEEAAPDGEAMPLAPAAPAENVQLTALNGAQVQAAQGIVQAVADGALPRESGVEMLASFFNMPTATADAIMGDVGSSFFSPQPEEG